MSKHEDMMKLLQFFYDETCAKKIPAYSVPNKDVKNLPEILDNYRLLKSSGFIEPYAECIGSNISCRLTEKGIAKIEGITDAATGITINTNSLVNNGIVGNNAKGNTINISQGYSFEQIQTLIKTLETSQEEKTLLIKNLEPLFDCIQKGYPLQKGMLSSISDHICKYQTLYAAVFQTVALYLCK